MSPRILIVDDDADVLDAVEGSLQDLGYDTTARKSAESALEILETEDFDVAITDVRMPLVNGIELCHRIVGNHPTLPVILMTAYRDVGAAVAAIRAGASDFITKPFSQTELADAVLRALRWRGSSPGTLRIDSASQNQDDFGLVGRSAAILSVREQIRRLGPAECNVLITGESGTGKELAARALHASSERASGPFVPLNCAGIPEHLLESELFGHVKGAFTSAIRDRIGRFELAEGGTILLDEIDSLPLFLQVKLLRVLQQKTFEMVGDTKTKRANVRIIAATNRELKAETDKGNFREDLYYRLNVITIDVPPLRDRRADIPTLVTHFIGTFSEKTKRRIRGISKDAMQVFTDYDWPGNVRELENTLERIVILAAGEVIETSDIPDHLHKKEHDFPASGLARAISLKEHLKAPERQIILKALEESGWNRKKASEILDINRTTLYNKMKEHQLL